MNPISTAQLKVRLAAIGIHGRSGRNTALMDLAVKLPPIALARMLGIHISTAGTWPSHHFGERLVAGSGSVEPATDPAVRGHLD